MASDIRLFIADDHRGFRMALRRILEKDPQCRIVGKADDGEMALSLMPQCGADVAILDIEMPNKDGCDVVRAMHRQRWAIKVVFLKM